MVILNLYIAIVNYGLHVKVNKSAHDAGISRVTVLYGSGTVPYWLWCFLGLNRNSKDLMLMIAEEDIVPFAMEQIGEDLHMEKPNHIEIITDSVAKEV